MILDAVVLGAGIHGLCSAFHLRRQGLAVTVLEQFACGHDRGSSHGRSRITRSSYHHRRFVDLATAAHRDGWPLLERELGARLLHRTPGAFFGPAGGPFGDYLRATLGAGAEVERLDVEAARRRFPLLAFADSDAVLLDHTAGLLAAANAHAGLRAWCRAHDVDVREHTAATALVSEERAVRIDTARGPLHAARVVVAAGPWTSTLLPEFAPQLTVLPQQVGYALVDAEPAATELPRFPVWARIGEQPNDFVYGLPAFERPGLKLARHVTHGAGIAADAPPPPLDEPSLLALARAHFTAPVRGLHGSEACRYTVAPDEDLLVQPRAGDARIVVVAACSGHGFKFAPELGRMAAALLA